MEKGVEDVCDHHYHNDKAITRTCGGGGVETSAVVKLIREIRHTTCDRDNKRHLLVIIYYLIAAAVVSCKLL